MRQAQICWFWLSDVRRERPQGWQSQTPEVAQEQIERFIVSGLFAGLPREWSRGRDELDEIEEGEDGKWVVEVVIKEARGAFWQVLQRRRWRSRSRCDAGGLIVQF